MNAPSSKNELLLTEARLVTSISLLEAQGLSSEAQKMQAVLRLQGLIDLARHGSPKWAGLFVSTLLAPDCIGTQKMMFEKKFYFSACKFRARGYVPFSL